MRASSPSVMAMRLATLSDINVLLHIESACFTSDRLSKRSFKHHISSGHSALWVCVHDEVVAGYILVLLPKGTRLARLYSLAVDPTRRGLGLASKLLEQAEKGVVDKERHYMRLEVAKNNQSAIRLYETHGYQVFGEYHDYYKDHSDALRMQKRIRFIDSAVLKRFTPWLKQSTEFTCGPASLMMAMSSLNDQQHYDLVDELAIWREATTIFMTSGHGGCHPFGLALAAHGRTFNAEVWVNTEQPLFVDGVRSNEKKHIMTEVHHQFLNACAQVDIPIHYDVLTIEKIMTSLAEDKAILMLVSTYRLDGKKAPHWVVLTGADDHCLYVHDPDLDEDTQSPIDCQHVPIAKTDLDKMAVFGTQRLRTAVVISKPHP